jgi:hypothetical protein
MLVGLKLRWRFCFAVLPALIWGTNSYGQTPRTDRVECTLPDGSVAELTSGYLQLPEQIGPSPRRANQSPISIQLKILGRKGVQNLSLQLNSAGGAPEGLDSARIYGQKLCFRFQIQGSHLIVGDAEGTIDLKSGKTALYGNDMSRQHFNETVSKRSSEDLAHLEKFGERTIGLMYADAILANGNYVAEQVLSDAEAKRYFGVFRSYSRDQGKTWTYGHVSLDPWLWDLSRDTADQCFHGRVRRVNGYVFEPVFPACAKPFDPNRSVPSAVWQLQ